MHKHLYEYMRDTCDRLEEFARQLPQAQQEAQPAA